MSRAQQAKGTKLIRGEQNARRLFSSVADPATDPHLNDEYFRQNPTWHVELSRPVVKSP